MTHSTPNDVKLPAVRIGMLGFVGCVLAAAIGGMLSTQRDGSLNDGLWTLVATIPGVLIPMFILMIMPAKQPGQWGVPVVAGTMIRALVTLTIGLAIYMLIGPAKVVFFLTMLAALMITLVIDVASVLTLIQKHSTSMMPVADAEGIS
jgi:hypothetical protein